MRGLDSLVSITLQSAVPAGQQSHQATTLTMAKKSFAPPVTNFSISCDPSLVTWLNNYAHEKRTSRSKVVRKALVDFRAEHEAADTNVNGPIIDPEERCVGCGAVVMHNFGRAICMNDVKRCNIEALPGGGHRLKEVVE